jgi:hypothetical protein
MIEESVAIAITVKLHAINELNKKKKKKGKESVAIPPKN